MKPLIISASARPDSNTEKYIQLVFEGIEYDMVHLFEQNIFPYNYQNIYPAEDEFIALIEKLITYKTVVFATPVYWYAMSGLLKTFFDRFSDLISIRKDLGRSLKDKNFLMLIAGWDSTMPHGFDSSVRLTAQYFEVQYIDTLYFSVNPKVTNNPGQKEIEIYRNRLTNSL